MQVLPCFFSSDEEAIEVSHVNLGGMKGPQTEISADEDGDIREQGRRYLPVRTEISASKDARLTDRIKWIKCRLALILYYEENESVSEIICVSLAIAKAEDENILDKWQSIL